MSVNFCHPAFRPDITCDKVCVDGYEVTNLVSGGDHGRSSPFLTESFIKPPVSVTVRFPCNVDVARIVFNSVHGAQRSCGFEVYSYCGKRRTCWLLDGVPVEAADDSEFKIFSPIGRGVDEDASVFCFVNKRYRERYNGAHRMPSRLQSSAYSEFTLAHRYPKHTSSVSELTLRITRVAGSGVCAIRWLEIWGQPAYCCPPDVIAKIQALRAGLFIPPAVAKCTQLVVADNKTEDAATDIPPEFVDPITQELMSVPVMLPSGNSVDQSTVDRHVEEEAKWGRAPSDLFTGVLFSATCKPVPNASLKMRIDKFLLSGMAERMHVTRRRLGGDRAGSRPVASRLVDAGMRQVEVTPSAVVHNDVLTISDSSANNDVLMSATSDSSACGRRKNSALNSGSSASGRVTERCGYVDDVKVLTPCEYNGDVSKSLGDGPRRKRIRRSLSQSTGRDVGTIDLTSDDSDHQGVTETRVITNRGRSRHQRVKGRKGTLTDDCRADGNESSTVVGVSRQVSPGTMAVRGKTDDFRSTPTEDKLSAHLQSRTAARRFGTGGIHSSVSDHRNDLLGLHHPSMRATATHVPNNSHTGTTVGRQVASHERDVDTSLEAALSSALSSLPTFRCRNNAATAKARDRGCCACGEEVKGNVMYRLECAHVMCRRCLLNSAPSGGAIVCEICRRETPSSGVLRIH